MKKSAYVLGTAAIFAGVFGALQFDRWMERRQNDSLAGANGSDLMRPVAYEESQALATPPDFRLAAKKVLPSVVSVDQYRRLRDFFGEASGPLQEAGTGSGVVISRDGTIVTNNHVVADAERVRVRFSDGRTMDAKVLGTDPRTDLAVLKVNASNLTPIEIGDNSKLEIGQWVIAVGNPLGFSNTVSVGVVSSLNRSLSLPGSFLINGIQTDAAINPGNSGGALTDASGRLVGINSAIASNTQGNVGIGFSIPVNRVRRVVSDIVKYGAVREGILGINYVQRYDGMLADPSFRSQVAEATGSQNIPENGVLLYYPRGGAVPPGGAAAQAGLRDLDIILEVDGIKTEDSLALNRALVDKRPGDLVKVKFWSRGQMKSADVKLTARQSDV